jgi:hypothetical protein
LRYLSTLLKGTATRNRQIVFVLLASLVSIGAHAQSASTPHPDSVLRSTLVRLQTNVGASGFHYIRVATRAAGRFRGHDLLPRGDTVVIIDRSSERAIALADIDSVWVQRDFGRGLAIVGGAVCALIGGALGGLIAADPDSGDASVTGGILIGGTIFGAICGAGGWLVGDLIRTWRLEYARPLISPG